MDPFFDDFFLREEILFPEFGGVTGTVEVRCPSCNAHEKVAVKADGSCDAHRCTRCGKIFRVPALDSE